MQILLGWVVGAAAAEVRLGDEHAEASAELVEQGVQLPAIGGRVERPAAQADVGALGHREADEAHARVAVLVLLRAGHGAGQALLAVEAEARGDDDVPLLVASECGPQGFLDRFGAGGGPHHVLQALATGA